MGVTDVSFVIAEGVNISPDERVRAMGEAAREIAAIVDRFEPQAPRF